jgi:hypothetical protein
MDDDALESLVHVFRRELERMWGPVADVYPNLPRVLAKLRWCTEVTLSELNWTWDDVWYGLYFKDSDDPEARYQASHRFNLLVTTLFEQVSGPPLPKTHLVGKWSLGIPVPWKGQVRKDPTNPRHR